MNINTIGHLVKTNPIQTQTNPICQRVKLMKSVYLQSIMKKNAAKGYEKTKPIQTQFLQRPKMNVNIYYTEVYENIFFVSPCCIGSSQTEVLFSDMGFAR